MQGEGVAREAAGGGRPRCTQRAGAGLDCRLGAGHGEERTANMDCMVVTPEVSKLSGWLNAAAFCREPKGGHAVRGEGAGQQTGVQRAGAGSAADWGQGTRGGAHHEHLVHVRDARGVEAQRLVERLRILPRVERRAYDAGQGSGREAGPTVFSVQWRLDCGLGTEQAWSAPGTSGTCS